MSTSHPFAGFSLAWKFPPDTPLKIVARPADSVHHFQESKGIPAAVSRGSSLRAKWLPPRGPVGKPYYSAVPGLLSPYPPSTRRIYDHGQTVSLLLSIPHPSNAIDKLKDIIDAKRWLYNMSAADFDDWLDVLEAETDTALDPHTEVKLKAIYLMRNAPSQAMGEYPRIARPLAPTDLDVHLPPCVRYLDSPLNRTLHLLRTSLLDCLDDDDKTRMVLATRTWMTQKSRQELAVWLVWMDGMLGEHFVAHLDDATEVRIRRIWHAGQLQLTQESLLYQGSRLTRSDIGATAAPSAPAGWDKEPLRSAMVRESWIQLLDAGIEACQLPNPAKKLFLPVAQRADYF
jgi:hypothetical protein